MDAETFHVPEDLYGDRPALEKWLTGAAIAVRAAFDSAVRVEVDLPADKSKLGRYRTRRYKRAAVLRKLAIIAEAEGVNLGDLIPVEFRNGERHDSTR